MSADGNVPSSEGVNSDPAQPPPWCRATASDLEGFDLEAPIADSNTADCGQLSQLYQEAVRTDESGADPLSTSAGRVLVMLHALTGMHFRPHDRNEPFGPFASMADGRRTATPEDFRSAHIDLIAEIAERATNPVLRARLADVSWLLDRKRGAMGRAALLAYTEIVERVDGGELEFPFGKEEGVLHHTALSLLRRALFIGRSIGWDKPETVQARNIAAALRKRAIAKRELFSAKSLSERDLDFDLSDPADVGHDLDDMITAISADTNPDALVGLWRVAADAYRLAKCDDEKNRCISEAAECLAAAAQDALAKQQPAMVAAHRLSAAIAQLHGVPGKRERRRELQHQLIDVQARIPDEMSQISHAIDLKEVVENAQAALEGRSLIDKLFVFASVTRSPDPDSLVRDAREMVQQFPLSSVFATSHHDHEGKVIHRSEGGGFTDGNSDAIRQKIAQAESIRRKIACAPIETIRATITDQHYLSDEVFASLLQHSPFVPGHLLGTFSRGFLRFFQGDFVGATYILTPLLENSLRHVLKLNGDDVTTFDDATQTQQDRTISSLFEQMRPELDNVFSKPITTDIENTFLNKPGPYLRHLVSHGLAHDGTPYGSDAVYGCWLIFQLCLFPLFPHRHGLYFPFD